MHQHHRAWTKEGLYTPEHLGCRVAPPVLGVDTPGGEPKTKLLCNLLGPRCAYAPRRTPEPRFYTETPEGLESLTRVDFDCTARAPCVAHVLRAVKLDLVSSVERFGNYLAMLEG